jgi:thiol-disulfide isomerase/thioredoxin
MGEKFVGREPTKAELLKIPYDSAFWNHNTVLKTTPLEDEIISDLGGGQSLTQQFDLYQQYEYHVSNGGVEGEKKFGWLRNYSQDRQFLYVGFWGSDCFPYLIELELFKRLQKTYRNKIAFVLLSVEDEETRWLQAMTKYNLFADGIIHYRIGSRSTVEREFKLKDVPHFVWIGKNGETLASEAYAPSNPLLKREFQEKLR